MWWRGFTFLVATALALSLAAAAFGQTGSSTSPYFMRHGQAAGAQQGPITCATSTTPITQSGDSGCRSISFRNRGTNLVWICRAATCSAAASGIYLDEGDSFTVDWSAGGAFSCIAVGGSSEIRVYAECS